MNYTCLAILAHFTIPRKRADSFPRWAPFTKLAAFAPSSSSQPLPPAISLFSFTHLNKWDWGH